MNINYSKELNDIKELKDYIKNNFNIDTTIRIPSGYIRNIKVVDFYQKVFLYIIILILYIFILYKIIKYNKKYILFVNIILFLILLYLIFYIICLFYSIYLYYNLYKNKNNLDNYIDYKNIKFETGDIIQEISPWYSKNTILLHILDKRHRYLHGGIIIKFKNKNYLLHVLYNKIGYSNYILDFDNCKYLEICPLDTYIKDNNYSSEYFRLFKNKNKLNNYKLFNTLSEINLEKIAFSYNVHLPENNDYDDNFSINYNCLNFIYKILYKLNIIPLFNFQNIISNDLVFLPNLSNNVYEKEIIIKSFDI